MKIGIFSAHSFARPGGVQNHVIALYSEFKKRGIDAKIITPGHSRIGPQGVPEKDIITIGISAYIPANQSRAEFSISIRKRFRERIWRENFDVLHFHNLGSGPLSYQILRHSNSLNILTIHATVDGSQISKIPPLRGLVHKLFANKFHGLIAVSPASLKSVETFGGFHNNPMRIIPNGIDLSRFFPRFGRKEGTNLLFVGRLEKRKGLMYLLQALASLRRPNVKLTIVGDGEERKRGERFVQTNKLTAQVDFAGNVGDAILPNFYQNADIFCAPAVAGESFGLTLLEAMACGTPIAGFANPGYSYVMQRHEEAIGANLLAPPGDHIALAQKIALLIDNQDTYQKARQWGIARVKQFSWPKTADQVLNFYREVKEWQTKATDIHRM